MGGKTGTLVFYSHIALVHGATNAVEVDEEGLREVGLDTPALVVNVVVCGVVRENAVDRVVGECVAAVIHYGLDS